MQKVICNNKVYAIFGDVSEAEVGKTTFIGSPNERLQFSVLRYNSGKILQSHIHKYRIREIERTQESWIILRGMVKIFVYDENKQKIAEDVLLAGQFFISYHGGHGYEIIADNTIVIENKLGDFVGIQEDKEKF